MATTSGFITVPDDGAAKVGTRVGLLDGTTVETQTMVLCDGVTFDYQMGVNSDGEIKFQAGNSVQSSQPSIGTTSSQIVSTSSTRKVLMIQNGSDTEYLYVGPTGVSSTTGFRVSPRSTLTLDRYKGALYGVFSTTTTTCFVLEENE